MNRENCRPDFVILAYPVISMTAEYSHRGSAENLLGNPPDPVLAKQLSNELNVTPSTPPTFLFSTSADTLVPPENTVAFYLALHKAGVPPKCTSLKRDRTASAWTSTTSRYQSGARC